MPKYSSRSNGCLTQKRRCPCGDEHCYIRVEGEDEDATVELVGEQNLLQGMPQMSSDINTTLDIVEPYIGQSFRTDEEAEEYYTNFARKSGFAIRRERSKGNAAHPLGVHKRELVCHRAGASLPRKTAEPKRQRNKKSSRCLCEAQMIIKKNVLKGVARWLVVHFSNVHNHELLDGEEVRQLPAYRCISPSDRERILYYVSNGFTVNLIMRALETEKGLKPGQLTFTERDLRNFLQSSKNINRENEGLELLKACKDMKDKTPGFRFEFTLYGSNKLEHIAWSYPDSLQAYKVFGDVLVFDTTYHLYAYQRPFGVWFGLDNYGNTIFFGCVLLQDDKPQSFRWALQSFIGLMDGKLPMTILTDLDFGLKDALSSDFPDIKHAFSLWHIVSKLSSWFSAALGSHYEKFLSEFHRICSLDSVQYFEHQWSQMIMDFGLNADRHIAIISFHRMFWALPYLRGCFFGSLMLTNFSMSVKSFFKGFLNSQTRLKDFVDQVAVAIDFQNRAGEEATMRQNYQNIKIKTYTPTEEHASTILTYHAFELFQKEIALSTQYAVHATSSETYVIRHHLKTDREHLVRFIAPDEVHCSCKEFETSGILCGHALRVLSLKNIFQLPVKYLLTRWRRDSSLFPRSSGYKYRSQALRSLASIIIQESSVTKDRFDYVRWHMSKLLTHVRDMPTVDETTLDVEPNTSLDSTIDVMPSVNRWRPRKLQTNVETSSER